MRPRIEPIFVTVKEAAEALGLQTYRVYELLNTGEIAGRYDKSKRLVSVASLREFAEGLPSEPPQQAAS